MNSSRPRIRLQTLVGGRLAVVWAAAVVYALGLLTQPAEAQPATLTWNDLVNHPERWPESTKINVDLKFSRGAALKSGTALKVNGVKATGAELIAPQGFVFEVTQKQCDLLTAANAAWAAYTPEQRALTLAAIQRDMTLWPGKATLTTEADFRTFKLKEGETYRVTKVTGKDVGFYVPGQTGQQMVNAEYTDVFKRARALAALPVNQRPGRMVEVLDGTMVDAMNKPMEIKPAELYVIYYSASTCPRCAVFTPKFVQHYVDSLAERKDVLFFGSPTDATMPPYFSYAQKNKMTWPTLSQANHNVMIALGDLGVIEIPGIVIFDKHGRVIMSTSKMSGAPLPVAEQALTKLDDQLKTAAP